MNDRNISATHLSSVSLWAVGLALAIVDIFSARDVGALGMVLAAGGATITVRGFFCQLARREQTAFEIGRATAREPVHPIH